MTPLTADQLDHLRGLTDGSGVLSSVDRKMLGQLLDDRAELIQALRDAVSCAAPGHPAARRAERLLLRMEG